jgi:hypothetical protein
MPNNQTRNSRNTPVSARRNRRRRAANRRVIPRSIRIPATTLERTVRLSDFPLSNDSIFISAQFALNNFLTPEIAAVSQVFTEYRYTHLNFFFQSIRDSNELGNAFIAFDPRANIGPPNDIDDVIGKPLYYITPAANFVRTQTNSTRRGLTLTRSVSQLNWYQCFVNGDTPSLQNTLGTLFFGGDHTSAGVNIGHLNVHYRVSFRN